VHNVEETEDRALSGIFSNSVDGTNAPVTADHSPTGTFVVRAISLSAAGPPSAISEMEWEVLPPEERSIESLEPPLESGSL
jgi:hypothetical protein